MNYPTWVNAPGLTEAAIQSNKLSYLLKYAALHHNPKGSVETLAVQCGSSKQAVHAAVRRGYLTVGMACAIESAVGKHIAPKHLLCPAKFSE